MHRPTDVQGAGVRSSRPAGRHAGARTFPDVLPCARHPPQPRTPRCGPQAGTPYTRASRTALYRGTPKNPDLYVNTSFLQEVCKHPPSHRAARDASSPGSIFESCRDCDMPARNTGGAPCAPKAEGFFLGVYAWRHEIQKDWRKKVKAGCVIFLFFIFPHLPAEHQTVQEVAGKLSTPAKGARTPEA